MRDYFFATPRLLRCLSILTPLALAACSSAPPNRPAPVTPVPTTTAKAGNSKPLPVLPPAGSGRGGYYKDDGPGEQIPDGLLEIPDAEPKVEPYSKAASRPYNVFGKTYTPIVDERPFVQRGIGSWYGKKFHGQKTSSGELYDMYKMTAAHPVLPIPSYVRVTNLKTGTQVIVRINDRGPFHSTRIIDLSYTAALKLGYLSSGSGELEVERLLPAEIERLAEERRNGNSNPSSSNVMVASVAPPAQLTPVAMAPLAASQPPAQAATSAQSPAQTQPGLSKELDSALASGFYLQFGAYSQEANARNARDQLLQNLSGAVEKIEAIAVNGLFRLYAGPYGSRSAAQDAAQVIRQRSSVTPFIVER